MERMKAPTPLFFQHIRNAGILLAAVGTAVVTAPVALPAVVIKAGSYLVVAGTVAGAVSQTATDGTITRKRKRYGRSS